jgi:hypothetical protein
VPGPDCARAMMGAHLGSLGLQPSGDTEARVSRRGPMRIPFGQRDP